MDSENTEKKIDKQALLVKSNALVNARLNQKYSLNEQKLILWVLSNVNEKHGNGGEELVLNAIDFANLINSPKENIYREAKSIATKLLSKTLLIEGEDEKEFVVCSWFSGIRYKGGQFHIRVYEGLIPHLINLRKCFTSYRVHYALTLQSSYAIRLYELLAQYRRIGARTFDMQILRMNLGIMDDELKQFGHFKTRVLDISEREINSKTDIRISWETIRKGQKVTHVSFKIDQTTTDEFNDSAVDEFHQDMIRFGVSSETALELVKNHDIDYLISKMNQVKLKIKENPGNIENPAGLFITAVEQDYQEKEKIKMTVQKKDIHKTKGRVTTDSKLQELQKQLENAIKGQESPYAKQQESLMQAFKTEEQKIRGEIEKLEIKLSRKKVEKA
jgi:plasmid replication initiation protein